MFIYHLKTRNNTVEIYFCGTDNYHFGKDYTWNKHKNVIQIDAIKMITELSNTNNAPDIKLNVYKLDLITFYEHFLCYMYEVIINCETFKCMKIKFTYCTK